LNFTNDFVDKQLESIEKARKDNFNLARQTSELTAAQAGVVSPANNDKLIVAVIVSVIAAVASPFIVQLIKKK
jgi:hypothetical protein